jgi:hypothetical protein
LLLLLELGHFKLQPQAYPFRILLLLRSIVHVQRVTSSASEKEIQRLQICLDSLSHDDVVNGARRR